MTAPTMRLRVRQRGHSVSGMVLFRSSPAILAVILAIFAVLGLVAVAGWHGAIVHDHERVELNAASGHSYFETSMDDDDHGSSHQGEPDNPVHILAHVASHWVGLANIAVAPIRNVMICRAWIMSAVPLFIGRHPSRLLRPPRG